MFIGWDAADWKAIHLLMDAGKMPYLLPATVETDVGVAPGSERDPRVNRVTFIDLQIQPAHNLLVSVSRAPKNWATIYLNALALKFA